jgi:hypothetical protein
METGRIFASAPFGSATAAAVPLSSVVAAAAAASSSLDILDLCVWKKEKEVEGEMNFGANLPA